MPYIHFTEEQKRLAASVDLVEFLRQRGEKLLPSGHEKRLDSDHSITVRRKKAEARSPLPRPFTTSATRMPSRSCWVEQRQAPALRQKNRLRWKKSSSNCRLLTTLCAGSMPICSKSGTSSVTC